MLSGDPAQPRQWLHQRRPVNKKSRELSGVGWCVVYDARCARRERCVTDQHAVTRYRPTCASGAVIQRSVMSTTSQVRSSCCVYTCIHKKVKVAHTRLPSVGFRSWSRFLAVSLQATWVINPAVGCRYFPPGRQLLWQPLRGLLPIRCLVNRGTMGVNILPKTVTRQRRGCDLNPGPTAPESSTLTTRLPSHHWSR